MRKVLLPLITAFLLFQCSENKEKNPSVNVSQSLPQKKYQVASVLPKVELGLRGADEEYVLTNGGFVEKQKKEIMDRSKDLSLKNLPIKKFFDHQLKFVENKGQLERFQGFHTDYLHNVRFYTKAFNGAAYFAEDGIGFGFLKGSIDKIYKEYNKDYKISDLSPSEKRSQTGFFINFLGANKDVKVSGEELSPTKVNFLKGSPDQFITDISTFNKVYYKGLYAGVDLAYYSSSDQLKYDFIVKPNADPGVIKLKYEKVKSLEITKEGELEIEIDWGILKDKKPYSYQIINGKKKEVQVKYLLLDKNTLGFKVIGDYNHSEELIIDPFTVQWATYIGTATSDDGYVESTVLDNTGRVLGTGWTDNSFPINASPNGYDKTHDIDEDAYVFRLASNGATIDYVTYLGGGGYEIGTGIALNSAGNICVSGYTQSYYQSTFKETSTTSLTVGTGSFNVTVASIGSYGMGSAVRLKNGSNYMDGTITGFVDAVTITVNVTSYSGSGTYGSWDIYLINTTGFPVTSGAIQSTKTGGDATADVFYSILNASGNNLIYSTYYGGSTSNDDWALDLILDSSGNAYITGRTQSSGMATAGVWLTSPQGGFDAFVLKITNSGTLGYFTYVGGAGNDICKNIAVTSTSEVLVTGMTNSSGLGTSGVFQVNISGGSDAFVAKLSNLGALNFYTYIGGSGEDGAGGIDLINNEPVIVGSSASSDFPMKNAVDNTYSTGDAFITRLTSDGKSLRYSSYIGGDGTDNTKGFDYTQFHKNGGIKLIGGKPVVVVGISSTAASMSTFLVSPVSYTAYNQNTSSNYTYNGGTYSGGAMGDMFVTVLDSTGTTVEFGSYFGGSDNDYPTAGINVEPVSGCAVFGGGDHSLPFPVTPGAFETTRGATTTPDQITLVKLCLPEILPVNLLNFSVSPNDGNVLLNWTTSLEINNDHFNVLRSVDGVHFEIIGNISGNGNSNSKSTYQFIDEHPYTGVSYYRLEQVDVDGKKTDSQIKKVEINGLDNLVIYPNPVIDVLNIKNYFKAEVANIQFTIRNYLSQEVLYLEEFNVSSGSYQKELNLQGLSQGMYTIEFRIDNEVKVMKFIKK